jgi:hypothetical protein
MLLPEPGSYVDPRVGRYITDDTVQVSPTMP